MQKCDVCKTEGHYRLRSMGGGIWACRGCAYSPTPTGIYLQETVQFKTLGAVSKRRVQELERRVILPYDKPGGGYYVGRRGENGKIQERWPNYQD